MSAPLTRWIVPAVAVAGSLLLLQSGCEQSSLADLEAPAAPAASVAAESVAAPGPSGEADAGSTPAPAETTLAQADPPAAAAAPRRAPQRGRDGVLELSFDDIKFDMEKEEPFVEEMLTDQIESFEGQTIRLRGYMLPSFQQSGIRQFVLVRDNMECCFGPGAALYDCVVVDLVAGKTADFSVRPVAVEGKFEFREFLDVDGKHLAIYHLDGTSVR